MSSDQSADVLKQEEVKKDQLQNFKDLKQETSSPPESMLTEQVDVKKEENAQEMLVENAAVSQDVVQMDPTEVQKEQNAQPERDESVEIEVSHVAAEENEQMETNQGNIENFVDELTVAVNDSTNLSEQEGNAGQEGNAERTGTSSELMETDQLTIKEDGVMQDVTHVTHVTYVTSAQSDDKTSSGGVTEDNVDDKAIDSEQVDIAANCTSLGSSDATVSQMPVAMEIDNQGEHNDARSLTKPELTDSGLESATVKNSASNQPVNNAEDETSTRMNIETVSEYKTNEALVQGDKSSETDGLSTQPTSNT